MPYPAGMSPGSMICPDCGKLIGVAEERCPFCGAWRPGFYGMTPWIQRFFGRRLDLDRVIVVACVALYALSLALQPSAIFQMAGGGGGFGALFGFLSPGSRALFQLGMTGGVVWQQGWWWTLFSAIYLHGSLLHIFFNLMWVRQLGPAVTHVYGQGRAFVIFTVAGAAGFLASNLLSGLFTGGQSVPTIGASGSIFGLLAALIVYGRRRRISMLTAQLWQWAIVMLVMGFVMSGVNNWAHLGGFAGGWASAALMRFEDEKRETPLVQVLALALLALTAFAVVMSFVRVTGLMLHAVP
jgi:rhomboid protease GluP